MYCYTVTLITPLKSTRHNVHKVNSSQRIDSDELTTTQR